MNDKTIALITGANKGIGFEIARQLGKLQIVVIIGARDASRGSEAVKKLEEDGIEAYTVQLEVTDHASVEAAAKWVEAKFGKLDVLINNAGITGGDVQTPSLTSVNTMRTAYETNVFGVVAVTNAMLPLLKKSTAGRIVNMSSGLGSITLAADPESEFGSRNFMAYQSSKSALNMVTVAYAKELREIGIKVNAADPGYTATDLNNHSGYRTTEQASIVAVRLATLTADGPTGTYQDESGLLPW